MSKNLKIYKASAGSGKTYTLALEFISYLIADPKAFSSILAVTFTNKSTTEMKDRIVKNLKALSEDSDRILVENLSEMLPENLRNTDTIRSRASEALSLILHSYGDFSVSTIDSFFQKVIRAFAFEIGLQTNYSVELNLDMIIDKAVAQVLDNISKDSDLREWLLEFISSKVEDGKSWRIEQQLKGIGKALFMEQWQIFSDRESLFSELLSDKNVMKEYSEVMKGIVKDFRKELKSKSTRIISAINKSGYSVNDFIGRSRGAAPMIEKLANDPASFKELKTTITKTTDFTGWTNGTDAGLKVFVESELVPLSQDLVDYILDNQQRYFTALAIGESIYLLGLSDSILKAINEYTKEENLFLNSNATVFLKRIIDGSDTPFIYERTGNRFMHYIIDEFQDTSHIQWDNFLPLVKESLDGGHSNLLVGDVKQSIYRWRNSDWEILNRGVAESFPNDATEKSLTENWRSWGNIISFNNNFFEKAIDSLIANLSKKLEADPATLDSFKNTLSRAYCDFRQNLPEARGKYKDKGYVNVRSVLFDQDKNLEQMADTIDSLVDMGHHLSQIAILFRNRNEAVKTAEYLNSRSRKYDIISDESLKADQCLEVQFIIAVMGYLTDPGNLILREFINREAPALTGIQTSFSDILDERRTLMRRRPVYEFMVEFISEFHIGGNSGSAVYLRTLTDDALSFSQKHSSDIGAYVTHWDEMRDEKKELSITMPKGRDAITMLTIHKSKGMEFDFVLVPFCDWEYESRSSSREIMWLETSSLGEPFSAIPFLPVKNSQLDKTLFCGQYRHEILMNRIDNLNLLYVVFTRAKKGLWIWTQAKQGKSSGLEIKEPDTRISGLVHSCLPQIIQDEDQMYYEQGTIPDAETTAGVPSEQTIPCRNNSYRPEAFFLPTSRYFTKSQNQSIDLGVVMHDILCSVKTSADFEKMTRTMESAGILNSETGAQIRRNLEQYLQNPVVTDWFSDKWEVFNESSILLPEGSTKRPDRVITDGEQTIVIDYKFGQNKSSSYHRQVAEYMELLTKMGYKGVKGFIWYVTLELIQEV